MAWPTQRQLRTFIATVETGSVSRAARTLNLTQPAASQQLRELERSLGVRLLERAGGKTVPTAAGEAVLEPARRAQAAVEDMMAAAAAHRSGEIGRVRFGTGATACIHLMPPVLAMLRARMPGLEILITTGNSAEICHSVEIGRLDVGLVTLPVISGRALSVRPLRWDPLLAVIPTDLAPTEDAVTPAMLAALPLILYDTGGGTRALIDGWFRASGITVQPHMQLDSIETIKVLVASGLGVSVMPELALTAAGAVPVPEAALMPGAALMTGAAPMAGAVVRRLEPPLARQLGLVLRREKVLDRGLRTLLEVLQG
jgi:DNA-binding transcriptional LysR family regulator